MPKLGREISRDFEEAPRQPTRRRFLTFLVAAPALTVAARVGTEILTPAAVWREAKR